MRHYLLFFTFLCCTALAEPFPDDSVLLGLYPTGNEVDNNGIISFEYASDSFRIPIQASKIDIVPIASTSNWECIEPQEKFQANQGNENRIVRNIRYNGQNELTQQQQRNCRPEVWFAGVTGIEYPRELPNPPWYRRWLGAKAPQRFPIDREGDWNIVMLMVDTLRSDYTPMYGHPFVIAPHMDLLAQLGIVFENSYGASSSTRPSVGSMFTGLQPKAHGAVRHSQTSAALYEGAPRIATFLKEHGYHTAGVSSNSQVTSAFGFDRGFDHYDCPVWESKVTPGGIDYLQTLDEPFFLYLHYMAPHAPYDPPDTYHSIYKGKTKYDELDRYGAEITLDDKRIGELLVELSRQGLLNRTLIWLVSDHGEEFWEHGWNGHGAKLFEESVRTVSVVSMPKRLPMNTRILSPVTHVDLFPSMLAFLGIANELISQGRNILPIGEENEDERPLFLHHGGGSEPGPHESDKEGIVYQDYKLIWWEQKDEWELYHLPSDPLEQKNLAESEPETKERLAELLKTHLDRCASLAKRYDLNTLSMEPLRPEDVENMKTYGYIK